MDQIITGFISFGVAIAFYMTCAMVIGRKAANPLIGAVVAVGIIFQPWYVAVLAALAGHVWIALISARYNLFNIRPSWEPTNPELLSQFVVLMNEYGPDSTEANEFWARHHKNRDLRVLMAESRRMAMRYRNK